jgi:hypothetical protein
MMVSRPKKRGVIFMKPIVIILTLALFLSQPGAIFALDIVVSRQGGISFSQPQVLGERSDQVAAPKIQNVSPGADKKLNIAPTVGNLDVRVIDNKEEAKLLREEAKTETKRLRMEIPVAMTLNQIDTDSEEEPSYRQNYQRKLQEERQARAEEKLEIRNALNDEGQMGLELVSRKVRAKVNGAQFTFDQETNLLTLTTPSGNVHILKHLPDQALSRMRLVVTTPIPVDPDSLVIDTNDDDEVIFRTTIEKNKRFLGIFKRTVETEIVLNDETGAVTDTEEGSDTLIGSLINALSF